MKYFTLTKYDSLNVLIFFTVVLHCIFPILVVILACTLRDTWLVRELLSNYILQCYGFLFALTLLFWAEKKFRKIYPYQPKEPQNIDKILLFSILILPTTAICYIFIESGFQIIDGYKSFLKETPIHTFIIDFYSAVFKTYILK